MEIHRTDLEIYIKEMSVLNKALQDYIKLTSVYDFLVMWTFLAL